MIAEPQTHRLIGWVGVRSWKGAPPPGPTDHARSSRCLETHLAGNEGVMLCEWFRRGRRSPVLREPDETARDL